MIFTTGGQKGDEEIFNSTEIIDLSGKGNLLCSAVPTQLPMNLTR